MWMIDNDTSYGSERNWVRDKNGLHLWIVAVKATFDVSPNGPLKLADEQKPACALHRVPQGRPLQDGTGGLRAH